MSMIENILELNFKISLLQKRQRKMDLIKMHNKYISTKIAA